LLVGVRAQRLLLSPRSMPTSGPRWPALVSAWRQVCDASLQTLQTKFVKFAYVSYPRTSSKLIRKMRSGGEEERWLVTASGRG